MNSPALPFAAAPVSVSTPTFYAAAIRPHVIAAQVTDLVEAAELGWNHAVSAIRESLVGERLYTERAALDMQAAATRAETAKVAELLDAVHQSLLTLNVVAQSMPASTALQEAHQRLAIAEANFSRGDA